MIPFWEHTGSRDLEVSLGIGSCRLTEFSVTASVVHHAMECEMKQMLNFSFRQLSPNWHPPGELNFVHSGTCQ